MSAACDAWNYCHDCDLPDGHAGDHACVCGDVWNRGPHDHDADDEHPDFRCADDESWQRSR